MVYNVYQELITGFWKYSIKRLFEFISKDKGSLSTISSLCLYILSGGQKAVRIYSELLKMVLFYEQSSWIKNRF